MAEEANRGDHLQEVSRTIRLRYNALAEAIVARQYALQPEFWKPHGDVGRHKSVRDARYHLSYLAEALDAADPTLFEDYVAWVKVVFASLNFPDEALPTTLQCTCDVLQEKLPDTFAAPACEYIRIPLRRLPQLPTTLPPFIKADAPLGLLARQYTDALLQGQRHVASRLILEAVRNGVRVQDVYLHVFQPSQREIGRLWQTNQVSVAQEHYCTAATQLIMSQLYPRIFATEKIGKRLVATSVSGELHEVGIRMVADFFEMEGWDTYYLGANTPTGSIIRTIADRRADVLAVSATMTFHINRVRELIAEVHASDAGQDVKILVGGYPFNTSSELWRQLGADGFSPDAQGAVTLADQLLTQNGAAG